MPEVMSGRMSELLQRWVKDGECPEVLVPLDYLELRRPLVKSGSASP